MDECFHAESLEEELQKVYSGAEKSIIEIGGKGPGKGGTNL